MRIRTTISSTAIVLPEAGDKNRIGCRCDNAAVEERWRAGALGTNSSSPSIRISAKVSVVGTSTPWRAPSLSVGEMEGIDGPVVNSVVDSNTRIYM